MIRKIGGYEITEQIGKGGFGFVYRGIDPEINQVVAIKVISTATEAASVMRFRVEAETAARISHPNVVTIFRFGVEDGTPYLVMEYLDGVTLQEIISQHTPLSVFDKIEIMRQTALGLQCAHERGVIHRDVKPANIMRLKSGIVKIMDFGIARVTDSVSTRLTQTGFMIGTIEYLAPEQFRSSEPDALWDVWSYGVVFYELLAGIHPCYSRDPNLKPDPYTLMHRITMEDPLPLHELAPEVPPALSRVVHKLLARDREARYQGLDDVLLDLDPIQKEIAKVQIPELIRQAKIAADADEIDHAQSVIRRVLELDAGNKEARVIRDMVRERVRHAANRPKVEELVREAYEHEKQRRFDTALSHLQSAIRLDPGSSTLRDRIEKLKEKERLARRSDAILNQARERLDLGDLTGAHQQVREAIEIDPDNGQAGSLLEVVDHAISERRRQNRLQTGMTEVNNLIVIEAYNEALHLLTTLIEQVGAEAQVLRRIEEVRHLKELQKQKERVNAGINAARELLKTDKFEEACRQLESLNRYKPGDAAIELLLNNARERAQGQKLQAQVEALVRQADRERKERRFDQAIRTLQQAISLDALNGNVLTLQRTILDEMKSDRERQQADNELGEARALFQSGKLQEAKAAAARLMAVYPTDQRTGVLAGEIQRAIQDRESGERRQLEKGLETAKEDLSRGRIENATALLGDLKVHYADNEAVTQLFQQAQRESEIQTTLAEVRKLGAASKPDQAADLLRQALGRYPDAREYLDELNAIRNRKRRNQDLTAANQALEAGRFEDAARIAGELLRERPGDPQLIGLQERARKELEFRNLTSRVRSLIETGEFDQAEETVKKWLAQFGEDTRVARIADEVRKEALRGRALRSAQTALRNGNFEEARKTVRPVLEIFPNDAAARQLLADIESEESLSGRRREIQDRRKKFEELLRAQRFDEAIREIQQLMARYRDEVGLREELDRAMAARDEAARRGTSNRSHEQVQRLLSERRLEEAITLLNTLLTQYPGDPLFAADLIDVRIAGIKASLQAGDAEAVLKAAEALLKEAEEPRARELLNWAKKTLAEAEEIRKRGKSKKPIIFAGAGAALAAVIAIYFLIPRTQPPPTPPPAGVIGVSPSELNFKYQKGDAAPVAETVQIKAEPDQMWTVTKGGDWLTASRSQGQGSSGITLGIDVSQLSAGQFSDTVSITSGAARQDVKVHLTVTAKEPPPPPPQAEKERLRAEPNLVPFSYQQGGVSPAAQTVHIGTADSGQSWSVSALDKWVRVGRTSGTGTGAFPVEVDPNGLTPGDYQSSVTVVSEGKERRVKVTLHVAETVVEKPKVDPGQAKSNALPDLPVVSCGSDYSGSLSGKIIWSGELPPQKTVSIGRQNAATIGQTQAKSNALPGCDVKISIATTGIVATEEPNAGNKFGRLTLRNGTPNVVSSIQVKWDVK